ncbi:sigma-70 family RNA polymerase sigma factor [Psychroflexus gondwanensis]|jgi:RNA polymerase sigma-70 factor (ECF subfamily)|uniref:RNA polymerase ECF-type sigma factor, sigma-70 family protein n=1 Tax=Psychroflexus gondwanensis ACAM 44 TaxID=1189619 RepID=N1WJ55_9FLAO|nr:sigma-70 family RNA polymerase sigma factor [Psychroflexus gondwanensis]EMY80296.1 RNA polymerase ECF-type sigma factor, sigma-70 family protein [Psychroflexus gondwanensis ACAM 44]TXE17699.1 sigma-70 family RNA polymerase sigma factor [Psychroflexus gondwanensis]
MKNAKPLFENTCEKTVFSKLHERYAKDLHDFIYYKFGEHYNPKDKVQEAFMKLWENCKKISPDKAKSYLFSVANNTTLNTIKHRKVVLKYETDASKSTSNNQDPQFLLEEKEYLSKYQKALSKLTEEKRVAFMLNRVEGKKHKEIAELLGISRKAVEKRIYSALKQLRQDIDGI